MASIVMVTLARGLNATYDTQLQSNAAASTKNQSAATLNLINSLVFAESKSVRTSTIILAAFNVLAAFTTAASILYDCYWASKRCSPNFKASKFCVSKVHPAETFPLVLSIGIVIQGLVYAAVQGTGLQSLFVRGCGLFAQFLFPAIFIVPFLQTVFGLECALRSLRALPFQARGKYDVTICSGTVVLMLIGTWVPTFLSPEPDRCFASLIWYISAFGTEGLIILSSCAGLMLISGLTIFVRLSTVNLIEQHQRIAASRMVYYLVLGIVSLAFVIPYFASQITGSGDIKAGMMATVVMNLAGLMSGLLQLFLRSNTATTSFGQKAGKSWDIKKHDIRMFGPNELVYNNYLSDPVSGPRSPAESRTLSREGLVAWEASEKNHDFGMEPIRSPPPVRSPTRLNPLASNAVVGIRAMPNLATGAVVEPPTSKFGYGRKQSYSLFPNEPSVSNAPTSVYDISNLLAPPSLGRSNHRRDSSVVSSATVQIGLRLSSFVMAPSQDDMAALPLPSTTYNANKRAASPLRTPNPALRIQTSQTPRPSSPAQNDTIISSSPSRSISPTSFSCINKVLPPTPLNIDFQLPAQRAPSPIPAEPEQKEVCQLSPAVYSPEKKSPKGPSLPSSPKSTVRMASPTVAPPQRSNSGRELPKGAPKSDWI